MQSNIIRVKRWPIEPYFEGFIDFIIGSKVLVEMTFVKQPRKCTKGDQGIFRRRLSAGGEKIGKSPP